MQILPSQVCSVDEPWNTVASSKSFTELGQGHVTWTILTNFRSPEIWRLHMNFGLTGLAVSKEKKFAKIESE